MSAGTQQTQQTQQATWPVVRRLLGYFRPHRTGIALSLVLLVLHSTIPGILVILIQQVLDRVLIEQDAEVLRLLPWALMGLYAANGAIAFGRGMLTRAIAWRVVTELRRELFEAFLRQDVAWHQAHPTGIKLARLTNDVNNIQYGVSGIVTAVQKPLTLLVLVGSAFWMNPKLAAIAVVLLPFVAIPIDHFGKRLRHDARLSLDNLAGLVASSTETFAGIRLVKAARGEQVRLKRFDGENEAQYRLQMRAFAAQLLPGPVIELIAAVGVGAVVWVGGQQVFAGEVAPGELVAFMVAMGLLNDPLKGLALIQSLTQRAVAGSQSVFAVLDRPSAVPDVGTRKIDSKSVTLAFEGVGFSYDGVQRVLQDVRFTVPAGGMVALVGHSGSGKTTVAALVSRFYDPQAGRVTINGIDLRELGLGNLRRHVAVVSQETFLFDDTVRANIAFSRPDASEAEIIEAARVANAHPFIVALPEGYDTRIDELGMRLSAGQRQRVCIARAVLQRAPVLVLDEATSALDTESEALVQEALERLAENKTVLAIAHRLSTIRAADEILVLEAGRVVEQGEHSSLLQADGVYARMVGRQDGAA